MVALNQTRKYNYFHNLDVSKGVKLFWKICKPYFSNKYSRRDTGIILIEKTELILSYKEIATNFNDYVSEIVPSLNLFKWPINVKRLANNRDITGSIVLKFHDHPSIKMIKNKFTKIAKFSFHQATLVEVRKAIKDIRLDKSSSGAIPADILRRCDLCFQALTNCINQSIVSGNF